MHYWLFIIAIFKCDRNLGTLLLIILKRKKNLHHQFLQLLKLKIIETIINALLIIYYCNIYMW